MNRRPRANTMTDSGEASTSDGPVSTRSAGRAAPPPRSFSLGSRERLEKHRSQRRLRGTRRSMTALPDSSTITIPEDDATAPPPPRDPTSYSIKRAPLTPTRRLCLRMSESYCKELLQLIRQEEMQRQKQLRQQEDQKLLVEIVTVAAQQRPTSKSPVRPQPTGESSKSYSRFQHERLNGGGFLAIVRTSTSTPTGRAA